MPPRNLRSIHTTKTERPVSAPSSVYKAMHLLRDNVTSWRAVLDRLHQGLCVFDGDHRLVTFNRRYAELYTLNPSDLRFGMVLTEIIQLRNAVGTGPDMSLEAYLRWHDGVVADQSILDFHLRLRDGRVLAIHHAPLADGGWIATHDDVTERLRVEDALRDKAALLDATLSSMDQGLVMVDEAGVVRLCNDRAIDLLDLPATLMRTNPHFDAVIRHQDDAGEFDEAPDIKSSVVEKDPLGLATPRYERQRPNGTVLEIRTVPLIGGGAVRTYTDVTERKRAETSVADSEARLRLLTDTLPQMLWVSGASDGGTTYANQRFHDYVGDTCWDRASRIEAQHPDDRDSVASGWARSVAAGENFEIETRWRRRDGAYRWHKVMVVPLYRDGVLVERIGTAIDIDDIVAAREMLREKTALVQLAQEAAGAGLFDWRVEEGLAHLSPESLRLFNLPEDRATHVAMSEWAGIIHPDDLPEIIRETERALATRTTFRTEFRIPRALQPDRWLLGVGRVVVDPSGQANRIVGLCIDLTDRKHTEETLRVNEAALRSSEERLALAMDAGSDGLWDWDIVTGAVWYSDRWQAMLGYGPGELEAHVRTWERLIHPGDRDRAVALLQAHFAGTSPLYECEHRLLRRDGGWGWVLARGKVVARDAAGAPLRIVGTHLDIDARKAAEAQVAYMACHDALTDLPNRTLFRERLDQKLGELRRHGGRTCAVLCLDLDRFKAVNDTLGHLAGDALLRIVAQRLRERVRVEDTVARLGGDEFAIVLDSPGGPANIAALAERLIKAVEQPITLGDHSGEVGLSVGIALAPDHGLEGDDLLKRADLALYRAKAAGRNTHRFFEPAMDEVAAERRSLEHDLRLALGRDEFVLHYQPQVLNATGETIGFEALVRWQHPTRGLVMPGTFVPLAEDNGLIVAIGEWVLRAACREAVRWTTPYKIAVNVSPRQMQYGDLAGLVGAVLSQTGLTPPRLVIEITEGVLINDVEQALGVLRRLKAMGVHIAIDDFGTGHSSLTTLNSFPFDTIKIDRSFVGRVEDSPPAAAIVRAVLGLGRSLGMRVVAEGVETEAQMRFLSEERCDEMQGYLFGRPQPIAALLRDGVPASRWKPAAGAARRLNDNERRAG